MKKKINRKYHRILQRYREYGIGDKIDNLKFKIGQTYIVKRIDDDKKRNKIFVGKLIQETKDHITLESRWRESYLKKDFLIGAYEIREVSQ